MDLQTQPFGIWSKYIPQSQLDQPLPLPLKQHSHATPTAQQNMLQDAVECAPPSRIKILVVGAGVGGLTAALECHRRGHAVTVVERSPAMRTEGDMFTIGQSALSLLDNYPTMKREYETTATKPWMRFRKYTGQDIGGAFRGPPKGIKPPPGGPPMTTQLRPLFHAMLHNQLERFGIQVEYNTKVVEFYEGEGVGGIICQDGTKLEADLVIAADGLHTKSANLIPPAGRANPTGRTVFRAAFPLTIITKDPLVNETFGLKDGEPVQQVWMGPNIHSVILSYVDKNGNDDHLAMGIAVTDDIPREESWTQRARKSDLKAALRPEWAEAMKRLVDLIPDDSLVAWPLNPRNPSTVWHSPGARVLQLGDAAHPFLPTSGNGATQAMEDGITIAACLSHAGPDKVTEAVLVHNLMRSDRVACAQLMGFANAQRMQKANLDAITDDPNSLRPIVPRWIWSHRPEKYVNENYAKAAASLMRHGDFLNTNIPSGYTPTPWTVDEIEKRRRDGQMIELVGDWS